MELQNHLNKKITNVMLIILGTFISAIGINTFIVDAHLLSGGISGISLIIQYLFKIPAGYSVFILNIPLFILSYIKNSRRFTKFTLLGSLSLSMFLVLTSSLKNLILLDDPLLLAIYGGLLNGIGIGLVFSNYGSTGGLDIISVIVKKKHENFDIGKISFSVNLLIVSIGAIWFGLINALYTLISMYITSFMIDKVIKGFNKQKMILIITQKDAEVSNAIMKSLHRGVTLLKGEGGYTREEKNVLYCITTLSQLPHLKLLVKNIDKNSFISILDVSEVQGKGFNNNIF